MGNKNNDGIASIFEKIDEAHKVDAIERMARYAGRKAEKCAAREKFEDTAIKLRGAVDAALETEHSPEELAALAAALLNAAMAMHSAEIYAEFAPMDAGALGISCAV